MRDAEGKMDGKLIGKVLGYFSDPSEREGKVFVFPHIFAEVMQEYMQTYGVTERDLVMIAVQEYANAKFNPCAQMNKAADHALPGGEDRRPEPLRDRRPAAQNVRLLADHRRLRRAHPGHRRGDAAKTRRAEIRTRGDRGLGAGDRPDPQVEGRDVLCPAGANRVPCRRRTAWPAPRLPTSAAAEVHDCFTVMGARSARRSSARRSPARARSIG